MKKFVVVERPRVLLFVVFVIIILPILGLIQNLPGPGYHVRNAADTAALAAALCRVRSSKTWTECASVAYDMAAINGYDNDLVSNKVEVYTCDMAEASCGDYAGNPDYIQAIITSYDKTFLTGVVGLRERHLVQAMALAQPPAQVQLLRSSGGTGLTRLSWVFSVPPWLQSIPEPYIVVLLILIVAIILGLLLLIRRRRVVGRG